MAIEWDFGIAPQGWIPPEERNLSQLLLDRNFFVHTPIFGQVNKGIDLPSSALLYDLEKKATGKLLPRIWQKSGSCVGSAAARSYSQAMCGDVVMRGDVEDIKIPFPFATYGVGRQMGGMRRPGEGSFGSAQARAVEEWGMLPFDDQRVPQPTVTSGNWLVWSSSIEVRWSHPSSWPLEKSSLDEDAAKYQIQDVASIRSISDLQQSLAQGYGVTVASNFGTRPQIESGFLVGDWNTSWAHQMSISGYHTHPKMGILFAFDNQWGPEAHPDCPFLSAIGVHGSFWVRENVMAKIFKSGAEVFVHSNTLGFPARSINWDMGIGI